MTIAEVGCLIVVMLGAPVGYTANPGSKVTRSWVPPIVPEAMFLLDQVQRATDSSSDCKLLSRCTKDLSEGVLKCYRK